MPDGGAAGDGQGKHTGAGSAPTQQGDAGGPRVEAHDQNRMDGQLLWNRAFREGAEKAEAQAASKLAALEAKIKELTGDGKNKVMPEAEHLAALDQVKHHYDRKIEGYEKEIAQMRQGQIRQELMRHARGANDPEDVAILLERRVRLNEQGSYEVLTSDGMKAIDPQTGHPLSIQQLVEETLRAKPWLAKAPSNAPQQGAIQAGQVAVPANGGKPLTREQVRKMTAEQYAEAAASGALDALYGGRLPR